MATWQSTGATSSRCQCEHEDHFDGADHNYQAVEGSTPALYVAWICDDCATGHLSEYVRAE